MHDEAEGDSEDESEEEDLDSDDDTNVGRRRGWRGKWPSKVIELDGKNEPLGSLEKIIWHNSETWALKIKLVPVPGSVQYAWDDHSDPEREGRIRLTNYTNPATVVNVEAFVTPASFGN